jgi:putative copper export protein
MSTVTQTILFLGLAAVLAAGTSAGRMGGVGIGFRHWAALAVGICAPTLFAWRLHEVAAPAGYGLGAESLGIFLGMAVGKALAAMAGLALLAAALGQLGMRRIAAGSAGAAIVALSLAGHSVADGEALRSVAQAMHLLSAAVWVGVILVLGVAALQRPQTLSDALRQGSPIAAGAMVVTALTGWVVADRVLGTWPALFGTGSGRSLLVKLAVLSMALLAALWLRLRGTDVRFVGLARRVVVLDIVIAVALVALAGLLSRSVPGAHDAILWPFPLRPNAAVALRDPTAWDWFVVTLGVGAVLMVVAGWLIWRGRAVTGLALGLATFGLSGATTLHAVSVEAYPTTFLHGGNGFTQPALEQAAVDFAENCATCHGREGRGDGPLAAGLDVKPADLAAAHVGDHTMGDMFWWISNGKSDVMPGFEGQLDEPRRWGLVNYTHLLSLQREARLMPDLPTLALPFLPAIDLELVGGGHLVIPEGGTPTLLVFTAVSDPGDVPLHAWERAVTQAGGRLVVAPRADGLDTVGSLVADAEGAWLLWSRYAPEGDLGPTAFLIDRWGFVRGVWSGRGVAPDLADWAAKMSVLLNEPQVRDWRTHGD